MTLQAAAVVVLGAIETVRAARCVLARFRAGGNQLLEQDGDPESAEMLAERALEMMSAARMGGL